MIASARSAIVTMLTWIAGALFAAIFVVNIVQIVARQVQGGWIWVGDLTQLMFAWMVMLGAAAAYGRAEHIVADFLLDRLPRAGRLALATLLRALELVIGFVILVAGMQVASTRMSIDYVQLGWPTGLAYFAIPTLGLLMLLFGLTSLPGRQGERTTDAPEHGQEGLVAP